MSVHYSSESDEWETPQAFFDEVDKEFGFTLDVCAQPGNKKCDAYFSPEVDGLSQLWTETCWMNPPYSQLCPWLKKACESARENGATVVALVPARTDTAAFHDYVLPYSPYKNIVQRPIKSLEEMVTAQGQYKVSAELRFIRGRLKFSGHKNSAPFPSMLVIFRPQ